MSMITEQVERLRTLADIVKDIADNSTDTVKTLREAADTIEQLAAKVRPITGHWIPQEMETYIDGKLKHWKAYKCNKCNNLLTDDYEYCPNCGAKMHLLIEEMTGG